MSKGYITAVEFCDFTKNQDKLIGILNHSITKLSVDVCWLKRFVGWQVGLVSAIAVTVLLGFIKLVYF